MYVSVFSSIINLHEYTTAVYLTCMCGVSIVRIIHNTVCIKYDNHHKKVASGAHNAMRKFLMSLHSQWMFFFGATMWNTYVRYKRVPGICVCHTHACAQGAGACSGIFNTPDDGCNPYGNHESKQQPENSSECRSAEACIGKFVHKSICVEWE